MLECMENLKIISSFHKNSRVDGKIQNRLSHGFVVRVRGYADYIFADRQLRVNEGEMIFIPKGSTYRLRTHLTTGNLYTSINFQADFVATEPRVYSLENFYEMGYVAENFSERWNFGTAADRYKCLSVFYDLLSYVSKLEHLSQGDKQKYQLIEPAVDYLKKHLYDPSFKVDKLHYLCGISDTYFRTVFAARFNMSPREYVIRQRISHARSILESGDFETVKEVAESVGYSDPLYFSKAFKKIYGYSPTEANE